VLCPAELDVPEEDVPADPEPDVLDPDVLCEPVPADPEVPDVLLPVELELPVEPLVLPVEEYVSDDGLEYVFVLDELLLSYCEEADGDCSIDCD